MKKILVVQNTATEGLGSFADEMKQAGIEWELVKAYAGERIPTGVMIDEAAYRGLMILGGPMSALDDKAYPFLAEEVRLIQDALERKLPMLNICLGAQLLARACGMPIRLGQNREVGWHQVTLNQWYTQRNPLFFQAPTEFVTFHWHQDSFEIPTDAYRLARSEISDVQAFCYQGNAYGLQFHPEVTEEMIRAWVENNGNFISQEEGERILADMPQYLAAQKKLAHQLIYGFETTIRPSDYRGPKEEPKPVEAVKPAEEKAEEQAEEKPEAPAEEAAVQ